MPDFMDIVQERQQEQLTRNIDAARLKPCGAASPLCIDCDRPIPAERRAALPHAQRCIYCQSLLEVNAKHHRGQA